MRQWKASLFLIILALCIGNATSQTCKIISPAYTCVNSLVNIYLDAGSNTPVSYLWKLGDGRTATQPQPGFTYLKPGTYTLSADVKLTGGGTCTASENIIVYDIPIANFITDTVGDYCSNRKTICIRDISLPGPSANPIVKRTFLWGDGNYTTDTVALPKRLCHPYSVAGQYLLAIEVTDSKGCLAKKLADVTVPAQLNVLMAASVLKEPAGCKLKACFTNNSKPMGTGAHFTWYFGDGSADSSNYNTCHEYIANGTYTALLIARDYKGCQDTATAKVTINKPALYAKVDAKKIICYNDVLKVKNGLGNTLPVKYNWLITDSAGGPVEYKDTFSFFDHKFSHPGKYYIHMSVGYDSCTVDVLDSVEVRCPKSVFSIFNANQCVPGDTTYFCSQICTYKAASIDFIWDMKHGEQCTTDTKNGINTNRNCQYSLDENPKHVYDFANPGDKFTLYKPQLISRDTITGCSDISGDLVRLGVLDMSKYSLTYSADELCTNDKWISNPRRTVKFVFDGDSVVYSCQIYINYDSAVSPLNFESKNPRQHEYEIPDDDTASKTVGLTFENGNQYRYSGCGKIMGPGSFCYDTAWLSNLLNIMPAPRPALAVDSVFKACKPYQLSLKFKDTIQKNIKSITWDWDDGTTETYALPPGDSLMPEKKHNYPLPGIYHPKITMTNTRDCEETQQAKLAVGFISTVKEDSLVCAGTTVKFGESIRYYDTAHDFWKDDARSLAGKEGLWWDFDDGKGLVKKLSGEGGFIAKEGTYNIRMVAVDSTGCTDTSAFTVKAVKPVAAFSQERDTIYCNDNIVQFHDASIGSLYDKSRQIATWNWDFGDGKGTKPFANPLYIFKTYGNKIIRLVVSNDAGCYDTAYSSIYAVGPVPAFQIVSDSTGCSPLTVELKNNSKDVNTWMWNMGDSAQTIIYTAKDTNIRFTYTMPGTYYITLTGTDSIYNPITLNKYFCSVDYPQAPMVKKIVVSDHYITHFEMPDTVCLNSLVLFQNTSDKALKNFVWNFGDGSKLSSDGRPAAYTYHNAGPYTVRLDATNAGTNIDLRCLSFSQKNIFVEGIKAAFDISQKSLPVYHFINTSSASAKTYTWDFGDPMSGADNRSTVKDPSHKFSRKDTFKICLIAQNRLGCPDTACQKLIYNYVPYLFIPNVFTPDGNDTINGAFDIKAHVCVYYELTIYNRWGQKVFESDEDGEGNTDPRNWNGRLFNTGEKCPSGVYYVVFNYQIGGSEERNTYHGTLTLLRE